MSAPAKDPTPTRAFLASIGIFIAAAIAVVLLWVLVGAWLAVIALGVAFFGIWGLLAYSLKRMSDADAAHGGG